jgi:AraC family transcriptional regulator, regulatory protein of adaptative response / DNA-3-methyladenine glycosylase II
VLGELGIIRSRGGAIIAAAGALADGSLQLEPGAPVEPALAALTAIRGIGPWTAHYIAMRTLGWRDAFPPGDVVARKALQAASATEAARRAEAWRPWRAYALLHLWRRSAATAAARRSA